MSTQFVGGVGGEGVGVGEVFKFVGGVGGVGGVNPIKSILK